MASNLPENLVGDMMSNAPRFTLPNFGAQNRPAPRPAVPASQDPGQNNAPSPSTVSPAIVRKSKPAQAPATSKSASRARKERITFSTSPVESEILERRVLELKLKGGSRRDANVSRVIEDALRDRVNGGELDLSVLDDPRRSMGATRYSRAALIHHDVYKNLLAGLVSARAAHPEIPPSNLTASAYIRACILALDN